MIKVLENPIPLRGGVKLVDNRGVSLEMPLAKAKLPQFISLPISGTVVPVVNVGEAVLKGQMIAKAYDENSISVYASTSGTVRELREIALPQASNIISKCIVIETDGEDKWDEDKEPVDDYHKLTPTEVIRKIIRVGIIGSSNFYKAQDVSLLIINAAETEPYISCDEAIIRTYIDEVIKGIEILVYALQVESCVITIEEDKTEIIRIIKDALSDKTDINIELKLISSLYPASEEKQLIKSISGLEVSFETPSIDEGIIVENISTAYAVKKAIINGEPLISRVVTVTGPGINQPCNLEVLLGTPVNDLIEQCGGYTDQFEFLASGGPMKGVKLESDLVPLTNSISCLLAFTKTFFPEDINKIDTTICHYCEEVCPVNLKPHELYHYAIEHDNNSLIDSGLFDCIECGCCNYVCSNHIQLLQEFRQAKIMIREQLRKKNIAEENKKRYFDKIARKEKLEEEKTKRRMEKASENKDADLQKKKDVINAAVNRVRNKREERNN